jgi:3-oxoacyl-[acyl-carrier-protein] synthase-1
MTTGRPTDKPIVNPLRISNYTVCSAVGAGRAAHVQALRAGTSGLRRAAFDTNLLDCWLGEVREFDTPLTGALAEWDCRNNRLAAFALEQDRFLESVATCRERYGAGRIGVFVGTSTSGVQHTELAYRARNHVNDALPTWFDQRRTQNIYSVASFTSLRLGLCGPAFAISTACSSSAKVFAAASRAIVSGACDAAVVGGVDSLCLTTIYGFNSLKLVSAEICRPADSARAGISIGEAGGFALLDPKAESPLALLGYGETSDAFHMSLPEPDGRGAVESMRAALVRANTAPDEVDYINLHGTGTIANDNAESRAVCNVFGAATPCSSTKGWTGHSLGAAGMVEAAISLMAIENGLIPRSLNTRAKDPAIEACILLENRRGSVRRVLSNSFGFGGSNCSLLFGSAP